MTMKFQHVAAPMIFKEMLKKARKEIKEGKLLITCEGDTIYCDIFDEELAEEQRKKILEKYEKKRWITKKLSRFALSKLGLKEVIDHEKGKTYKF